jgi:hypothetical protein
VQIGILIHPDVEVRDVAGPFKVFALASRIAGRVPESTPLQDRAGFYHLTPKIDECYIRTMVVGTFPT